MQASGIYVAAPTHLLAVRYSSGTGAHSRTGIYLMSAEPIIADALAVVLGYLRQCEALIQIVGERLAAKHHFGAEASGWALDEPALVVRLDGGNPVIAVSRLSHDLDLRFYAPTQIREMEMWRIVQEFARTHRRMDIQTQNGVALLHFLTPISQPSFLFDDDLALDFLYATFHAEISMRVRE